MSTFFPTLILAELNDPDIIELNDPDVIEMMLTSIL
jgi:hypothetical protein